MSALARIKLGDAKSALECAKATMSDARRLLNPTGLPCACVRSAMGSVEMSIDHIEDALAEMPS